MARGRVSGTGIASKLNSLRHEATFAKARRARAMHQRASANANEQGHIDAKLEKLWRELDLTACVDDLEAFRCVLSGDSGLDVPPNCARPFLSLLACFDPSFPELSSHHVVPVQKTPREGGMLQCREIEMSGLNIKSAP